MTRKLVGQVTPEEKNEIQSLFERRNGLNELAKVLTADNAETREGHGRDRHQIPELVGQPGKEISMGKLPKRQLGDQFRHLRNIP